MSKEARKVPELRFKGFFEDWEQREFNSIVDRVSISSTDKNLPRVEYEDIISDQGILNKDVYSNDSKKNGIEFEANDILFGKLRPYLNKWLNPSFKGIAVGDFWVLRTKEIESKFVYYMIQTFKFKSISNISTGTKMPRADWSIVSNSKFFVPKEYTEGEKISKLVMHLELTMTLHHRKVRYLKQLKKIFLIKNFTLSQKGIPKLRFNKFRTKWKKYKLSSVIDDEIKGKAKSNLAGTKSRYLDTNHLNGGKLMYVDSPTDVNVDDVLILWDGSQAGTLYHGFEGALGSTLKAFRPKYSGTFLYHQLKKDQEVIYRRYRTPNIPHVVKSFTNEFSVWITDIEEQIKV